METEMEIDLYTAEAQAPILGQDFLTWLWFKSEKTGGVFYTDKREAFVLVVEQRIAVQGGEGESKETAVVSGPMAEMREAKIGLRTGKKVHQAKIRLEQDENAWQVQLSSTDFTLSGLKTPKVDMKLEEGEDPDARFLEKMYLVEKSLEFLDSVYHDFLRVRLGDGWKDEVVRVRAWMEE